MELENGTVELRVAAEEMGVHYQTAYRWVRSGRLPAKMLGGKYIVAIAGLQALTAERRTPVPLAPPGQKRVEREADRMHRSLVDGDEAEVRRIARRLVDEGITLVDLIQSTLVPPLRRIGQDWHDGRLEISLEHRAAAIIDRLLGELAPNPRGRRRGTAVVASVSGDQHSLPTSMATIALREGNWRVHHLGADLPSDELLRFAKEHAVDLVVISLTNPQATILAHETAERLRSQGTATIVGAPGMTLAQLVEQARTAKA